MTIKIVNPTKDIQGNARENIFLIFDSEQYCGSGYVFPKLTPQITPQHVLNIFLEMHIEEVDMKEQLMDKLYEVLYNRCLTLAEVANMTAFVYHGAVEENKLMRYLKSKGYDQAYKTFLMALEQPLKKSRRNPLEYEVEDVASDMNSVMIKMHDGIFIRRLSEEHLDHMKHQDDFKWVCIKEEDQIIASMMFYKSVDKIGMIDHLYVLPKFQNQGLANKLMTFAQNYFRNRFVETIHLEVWSANEKALRWYQKNHFIVVRKTEEYLGKIIKRTSRD